MSCVARINAKLKRKYKTVNERDVGFANIIVSVHAVVTFINAINSM
jgi:hypothetical protein